MQFRPEETGTVTHTFSREVLEQAVRDGTILESRALSCDTARSLHFALGDYAGVMPREECATGIQEGTVRDIAILSRVGHRTCFVVTAVRPNAAPPHALLSRRLAQERCMQEYLDALHCGDIIPCRVTHLESFGAFCDVGCGVCALLPIDCMSVSRIASPADRFRVGENIFCAVKSRDALGRLVLSTRELYGTWMENAARFSVGETVIGVVRSTESYGIFVELAPNLAGLAEGGPQVERGQIVSVYIKSINAEKMKLKLAILQVLDSDTPLPQTPLSPTEGRLSHWVYSPPESARCIETLFDE